MSRISVDGWEPGHVSFSTMDGYRFCPMRTKLQKVLRVEQKPGLAGMGGNAFHEATADIDLLIYRDGLGALDPEPEVVVDDEPPF